MTICGIIFDPATRALFHCLTIINLKQNHKISSLNLNLYLCQVRYCSTRLASSQFYYTSSTFPLSKTEAKQFKNIVFNFVWGERKREMIVQATIETSRETGGLHLESCGTWCQSVFTTNNLAIPSMDSFSQPRLCLYECWMSFHLRTQLPTSYSLTEPHSFNVTSSYRGCHHHRPYQRHNGSPVGFVSCHSKLDKLPIVDRRLVSLKVLRPPTASESQLDMLHSIYGRSVRLWLKAKTFCGELPMVPTALKTGVVIAKYKIPGTKTLCVLCNTG